MMRRHPSSPTAAHSVKSGEKAKAAQGGREGVSVGSERVQLDEEKTQKREELVDAPVIAFVLSLQCATGLCLAVL